MSDRVTAPPGAEPNCMCADCRATLYWQAPPTAGIFSRLTASVWLRALWLVLAGLLGFFLNIWAGLLLLLCAGLAYIINPPGFKPRCPRCGSLDIRHISVTPASGTDSPAASGPGGKPPHDQ